MKKSKKWVSVLLCALLTVAMCAVLAPSASAESTAEEQDYATVHYYGTNDEDGCPSQTETYAIGTIIEYKVSLKASDKDVTAFDLHTWINQPSKTKQNTVEQKVLKVLANGTEGLASYTTGTKFIGADGKSGLSINLAETADESNQMLYNWATAQNLEGVDWSMDGGLWIVTLRFQVAQAGEVSVWTDINKLLKNGEQPDSPAVDIVKGSEIVFDATSSSNAPNDEASTEAAEATTEAEPTTEITEPEAIGVYGDVNGDKEVTLEDALLLKRHVAKLTTITGGVALLGDVNGDGVIDIEDALILHKYVAKLPTLHVGQNAYR